MRIKTYLEHSPIFEVRRIGRALDATLAGSAASGETGFLESLVLAAILLEEPKPVSPSRLAQAFSTTRSNMGHCISSLEGRGLIRRKVDQADARVFQLSLRPQGRQHAMQAVRMLDRTQRNLEQAVGLNEIQNALAVLRRVEKALTGLAEKKRR